MKIFLNASPHFTGELYKIYFENGLSTESVPRYMFDKFSIVEGLEPVYVADSVNECAHCKKLSNEVLDLQNEIMLLKLNKAVKKTKVKE